MEGYLPLSTARRLIQEQVVRHPLLAFLLLAFGTSWVAWLLAEFLGTGPRSGLFIVGVTAPALAAMAVSAILRPKPSAMAAGKRWWTFLEVWILVLVFLEFRKFWITLGLINISLRIVSTTTTLPSVPTALADALAAAAVALVLTCARSTQQGVDDLLHSLDPRRHRVGWYWFLIAVGLYPVTLALGNTISTSIGLPVPDPPASGMWIWLALDVLLTFLYVLLCGGGLEEPAWRSFALPWLQKRSSPLRSSLILAVIWAFWHWPMFWFGYYGGGPLGVLGFVIGTAPVAILFTAVFNRTGGSLPIVILLHTSINTTPLYLPASPLALSLWMLMILFLAFRMWRAPQTFSSQEIIQPFGLKSGIGGVRDKNSPLP